MATSTDLCYTPATELGSLIRAKQVSPVEVTTAALARVERLNPTWVCNVHHPLVNKRNVLMNARR